MGSGAAAGWAIGAGGTMGAGLAGTKAEAGMTGEPVAADAVGNYHLDSATRLTYTFFQEVRSFGHGDKRSEQ